jgi:hypothetical protein
MKRGLRRREAMGHPVAAPRQNPNPERRRPAPCHQHQAVTDFPGSTSSPPTPRSSSSEAKPTW